MSSVQSRSLTITKSNKTSYLTASGSASVSASNSLGDCHGSKKSGSLTLNSTAKDILFPNATAHPKRVYSQWNHRQSSSGSNPTPYTELMVGGVSLLKIENSNYTLATFDSDTAESSKKNAALAAVKNTEIKFNLQVQQHGIFDSKYVYIGQNDDVDTFTFYFTRYDFSASAGANVASASVSSSTGYDGDSITYSCVLASGATFDGWYENGAKVSSNQSYTITVAGADKALEARATGGQLVRKRYMVCGADVKMGDDTTERFSLTYGDSTLVSDLDGAKTLLCKDELMSGNVHIGTRYADCAGKLMQYNLVAMLCRGEWLMNTSLNGGTSGTMASSGWCVTPYLPVPAGCTSITIEAGGTQSGSILHEYDAGLGYLSYWGGGTNPRTFNFDYPAQIKFVRATFNMANLAGCYIRDNTHGGYIYRGGAA